MTIRDLMLLGAGKGGDGANYVSGSFTVPETGSTYTLNFGKTISNYLVLIEATDASKEEIIASEYNGAKTYCAIGVYPKRKIGEITENNNLFLNRVNPSTSALTQVYVGNWTFTSSSIELKTEDLNASSANYFYHGLTYNYYVVEIK